MSKPNLGKKLKAKRIQEGLSLRELARIVGISFSGLSRIERGVGYNMDDTIQRVNRWIEIGVGSEKKERHGRPWILTVEQRLARIEQALGLGGDLSESRSQSGDTTSGSMQNPVCLDGSAPSVRSVSGDPGNC
jgi:transcriptional regulator with XRE-family HTH domain